MSAPQAPVMRVMTWNIHGGVGTDGKFDLARIVDAIARHAPDVVAARRSAIMASRQNRLPRPTATMVRWSSVDGRSWLYKFMTLPSLSENRAGPSRPTSRRRTERCG